MIWNNWLIRGVHFSLVSKVVLGLFFLYLLKKWLTQPEHRRASLFDGRYIVTASFKRR